MSGLCAIPAAEMTGDELFHSDGRDIGVELKGFWSWAYSALLDNVARGVLAEFLVAFALGITKTPREEWARYDLESKEGTTIEVKNSAYIQSWEQKDHSLIEFDVKQTKGWIEETGWSDDPQRHSDVYVFCLLAEKDQEKIDPMNVGQWEFYVVSTSEIDHRLGKQKTITLRSLKRKFSVEPTPYGELAQEIERAKRRVPPTEPTSRPHRDTGTPDSRLDE